MTLFDHVPDARLPEKAAPPTRAQDLGEILRNTRQRLFHLAREVDSETELQSQTEAALKKALKVGQSVTGPGMTITRVRGGLDIRWGS